MFFYLSPSQGYTLNPEIARIFRIVDLPALRCPAGASEGPLWKEYILPYIRDARTSHMWGRGGVIGHRNHENLGSKVDPLRVYF